MGGSLPRIRQHRALLFVVRADCVDKARADVFRGCVDARLYCAKMLPHPLGADAATLFDMLAFACFSVNLLVLYVPGRFTEPRGSSSSSSLLLPSFAPLLLFLIHRLRRLLGRASEAGRPRRLLACGSEAVILVRELLPAHALPRFLILRRRRLLACSSEAVILVRELLPTHTLLLFILRLRWLLKKK